MTEEENSKIATIIKDWLLKNQLADDTRIYFNDQCYSSVDYGYEASYELLKDIKASDYFKYANDKTVSMSFEGALHTVLNYGEDGWKAHTEFTELLEKHGWYFEFGHSWNLSLHRTDEV